MSRFIAYHATGGERELRAVLFDASVEQHIRQSLKQTPTGNFLAMPPDDIEYLIEQIQSIVGAAPQEKIALVTSMDVRRYARRMIEARLGWLPVYSYQELGEHVDLQPLGRVTF
jgi:type III secretion protein V